MSTEVKSVHKSTKVVKIFRCKNTKKSNTKL